jgi:type I restriction enzyme S subunit
MATFQKVKLRDIISLLTDYHANGSYKRLKQNVELLDEPNYAAMIRTTNFEKNDFNDLKYISEHAYNFLKKSKVYPDDILMNKIANAGSVYLMPNIEKPVSLAMNLFLIRVNSKLADQRYIFYYLKANEQYIKSFANGAATNTITKELVRNLDILVPNFTSQCEISSAISAYDELIRNNEKRIKILEEMARLLYTEWFVKFKFPGHEKVKMVDSGTEYGKIPQGWDVKKLGDFSKLVSRGPSLTYVKNDGIPVVNQRCVRNGLVQWEAVQYAKPLSAKSEDLYLNKYDCLINSMGVGTLGRVSRNLSILEKTIVHNCITLIRSYKPNTESAYLYYFIKSKENYFISSGVGATGQTSLKPEIAASLLMLIPKDTILEKYSEVVIPMWDEIGLLLQKNQNLSQIRNLLIPQLVTGKRELK